MAIRPAGDGGTSVVVTDKSGGEWRVEEDALVLTSDPSQSLACLPSHISYWFGWYGFHTSTTVYGQD